MAKLALLDLIDCELLRLGDAGDASVWDQAASSDDGPLAAPGKTEATSAAKLMLRRR